MKKKITNRYLAVVFCLLILGQEVASARVTNEILKKSHTKRAILEETAASQSQPDGGENSHELVIRKKRSVAAVINVLFVAGFILSLGNVGFDLYLKYGDQCCELYSSICGNEKKYNTYRRKIIPLSEEIDDRYVQAEQLYEWAINTNYELQSLWSKIVKIVGLNDDIVTAIDSSILEQFEEISNGIRSDIEANNETVLGYTSEDVDHQYVSLWDRTDTAIQTALHLASYPLTLIVKRVFAYFIQRNIAKFTAELSAKYGSALHNSLSGNGKAASFFGVKSAADVDVNVQQTSDAIRQAKFSKTVVWGGRVYSGLQLVSTLSTIGLQIWGIIQDVEQCEQIRDDVKEAAENMEEAYEESVVLNATVTTYKANITNYWEDLRSQLTSDEMKLVLEEIKNMTLSAANAERMESATAAIDDWLDNIDDADESGTYDLLGSLNAGLSNVSYTLTCYRNKLRAITYISDHCKAADGSLESIYDTAVAQFFLNDDECMDNSGYTYTTFEQIQETIESLAESNGYNSDCILNSETLKIIICYAHWNLETTATIAGEHSLTEDQVLYFTNTCGDKPLDTQAQKSICTMKNQNATGVFTIDLVATLLGLTESTVTEGLKNCENAATTQATIATEATTIAETTTVITEATTTTQAPTTAAKTTKKVITISRRRRRRRRRRRSWIRK